MIIHTLLVLLFTTLLAPLAAASPIGNRTTTPEKRQLLNLCLATSIFRNCVAVSILGGSTSCDCLDNCPYSVLNLCLSVGGSFDVNACACRAASPGGRRRSGIAMDVDGHYKLLPKVKSFMPSQICPARSTGCKVLERTFDHRLPEFDGQRYECLDVENDVESCGGCVSEGKGRDCTSIPHVSGVQCVKGRCLVSSCEKGWVPDASGQACVGSEPRRVDLIQRS